MWATWWVWVVAGFALGVVEVLVPGFIFLGFAIGAVIAAALVLGFHIKTLGPLTQPVFWLESLAIWAFGISWLVKGEAIQALVGLLRKQS